MAARLRAARRILVACGNPDLGRLGYPWGDGGGTTAFFRAVGGALAGESVAAASAGGAHSVVLLSSTTSDGGGGAVLTFGDNARGQLGHSAGSPSIPTPTEALVPEEVVAVAAGDAHTLALGASGGVWAWGSNADGQCGLGAGVLGVDQPSPRLVPALAGEWWDDSKAASSSSPPPRIIAVAAGGSHSAALAADGSVFTWGGGGAGQLGHGGLEGSIACEPSPRRVRGLDGHGPVAALAAGGDRTGVVLAGGGGGRVLVWGASGGVSGGARRAGSSTPTAIPGLHAITSLALGRLHALAGRGLAGPAVAWGDGGDHGALGVALDAAPGGIAPAPAPIITAPDGGLGAPHDVAALPSAVPLIHLAAVAAGWQHSLGVSPDGDLFAWGWGGSPGGAFPFTPGIATGGGQLGMGDDNDRPAAGRVGVLLEEDGMEAVRPWRAVGVSAGVNHSLAVVEVEE